MAQKRAPRLFAGQVHVAGFHGHCGLGSRISLPFLYFSVIPANAGMYLNPRMDSRFHGNDK
jgi:hypothetical protein